MRQKFEGKGPLGTGAGHTGPRGVGVGVFSTELVEATLLLSTDEDVVRTAGVEIASLEVLATLATDEETVPLETVLETASLETVLETASLETVLDTAWLEVLTTLEIGEEELGSVAVALLLMLPMVLETLDD